MPLRLLPNIARGVFYPIGVIKTSCAALVPGGGPLGYHGFGSGPSLETAMHSLGPSGILRGQFASRIAHLLTTK
jgi:hypothetical protein